MSGAREVRWSASTPGGIGNIGPGLDVLGCALRGARDEVIASWSDAPGVTLADAGHPELPTNPARHTTAIAARAVLGLAQRGGKTDKDVGVSLVVKKGLPLLGGQGGSAASAVAGASATNALLGSPLDEHQLMCCCLDAESVVAGRHLDNIAPSLLGGIVLVRSIDPIDIVRLPVPDGLHIVLAHPDQRLATAKARAALPSSVPLAVATHQMAQVAAMVAACYSGDVALFGRAIDDRIAEPARAPLLTGFNDAKRAALDHGALGVSISGAGPSIFAVVDNESRAAEVADAITASYATQGVRCTTTVTGIDMDGTIVRAL